MLDRDHYFLYTTIIILVLLIILGTSLEVSKRYNSPRGKTEALLLAAHAVPIAAKRWRHLICSNLKLPLFTGQCRYCKADIADVFLSEITSALVLFCFM